MSRYPHLDWEGCWNARDLGGMRAAGGRTTHPGALVRADEPSGLSEAGWRALEAHGVRTIVDLRNAEEVRPDAAPRPAGVVTIHLPLDGLEEDPVFWDHWSRRPPPLYYGPFLERFPHRAAAVLTAIARAAPGGVMFHCVGGRDRTGLISMLLLALAGVAPEEIADDHGLSDERLRRRPFPEHDENDMGRVIEEHLAREGTSARESILATLASVDVEACLRAGGVTNDDAALLRARMVGPTPPAGFEPAT
jgi:protein-tyrosine phosphatase